MPNDFQVLERYHDDFLRMLEQKQIYIRHNRIHQYPNIFDVGDEVAVFFPRPQPHHIVGRIIAYNGRTVDVQIKGHVLKEVSVFQLFRVDPPVFRKKR